MGEVWEGGPKCFTIVCVTENILNAFKKHPVERWKTQALSKPFPFANIRELSHTSGPEVSPGSRASEALGPGARVEKLTDMLEVDT